ncbi:lamin tail domain-containing protein [Haloarchaeobius sp. DFWS5]|uniref:lamin tail domain-containing protein n=1 Tax=Haloarchaeobius sp. DFWS5 TaxID=3446114 RepID=UPI003EBDC2E8
MRPDSWRFRALIVALVLCVVSAGCITTGPFFPGGESGDGEAPALEDGVSVTVTRVIDGDTIEIRYRNGTEDTVRLLGVDTPEVHKGVEPDEYGIPDTLAGRDWLQNWGENASQFVKDELDGETVEVVVDPESDRRGYYGRLLAYVYHDGVSLNEELLSRGLARVYDSKFSKRDQYYSIEAEAQSAERGVWGFAARTDGGGGTGTTDGEDGRTAANGLAVLQVRADAPGNDNQDPTGEYVVFVNRGEEAIDLSGYTVADEADHTYTVPDGVTLAPGDRLTLRSGQGTDGDGTRYWGSDGAIWNNGGDTVVVRDASGQVVLEYGYGSAARIAVVESRQWNVWPSETQIVYV